jgi:hypothetical protein
MPEFLKLPADLILVVYRLIINVALWQFINVIRLFSVQKLSSNFNLAFEVNEKKKGGKDDFQRKKFILIS